MFDKPDHTRRPSPGRARSIAIVGAGFGGIGMAIRLRERGFNQLVIYEKAKSVGGVWRDNTYPGAGCDVPSHLYSYSFRRRADWTRRFPKQPEILEYIEDCVAHYGLGSHIRFDTEITSATWDDESAQWELITASGERAVHDVVIWGLGQLNRPKWPTIDGLDTFEGTIFHSARWKHDHDLANERIGVIGNGASAVQFVPPIAQLAGKLYQFQHAPNWFLPKPDAVFTQSEIDRFRTVPGREWFERARLYATFESRWGALKSGSRIAKVAHDISNSYLAKQVPDPALRAKLTPDFPVGCKRILISDDYLSTLGRPNVEVVTDPITSVESDAIITADGVRRVVDTIIVATGFQTTDFLAPVRITGRLGTRLADTWANGAYAYQGIAVPDFPNSFILYGPNTNLNHNSIIFMLECQYRWILGVLGRLGTEHRTVDVRHVAARRYDRRIVSKLHETVFEAGCNSWYKNAQGKVVNNWPGPTLRYWLDTHWVDTRALRFGPR